MTDRIVKFDMTMIKIRDWSKYNFFFEKTEDHVYKCVYAKSSIHKAFLKFKDEFPGEEIIYSCSRKPHLTKKGHRAGKSTRMPPREREFVIKFSDTANEAFFLLKYSTEVEQ